jgi:peptidoglycan hydrolase-like protein with peptidoglycan-binding domain
MKIFELLAPATSPFSLNVPSSKEGMDIADLQKVLKALRYDLGPTGVDGKLGDYTSAAIKAAQADVEQASTGVPDSEFINVLNQVLSAYPEFTASLSKTNPDELKHSKDSGSSNIELDPEFDKALHQVAEKLGVNANDLKAIMYKESRLKPTAVNKYSGATGLIQFMPKTAAALGTSTKELYNMSAVEQLQYVYKYYKQYVRPGDDRGTLYMATFYPALMHHDDNHVISSRGKAIYDQNRGLDVSHDGVLTVGDVKRSVNAYA